MEVNRIKESQTTLERIHRAAKAEFLEKGYKDASLRNIVTVSYTHLDVYKRQQYSLPVFMTLQLCKGNVTVFLDIQLNRPLIMCNLSMKRSWQPIRERTASI